MMYIALGDSRRIRYRRSWTPQCLAQDRLLSGSCVVAKRLLTAARALHACRGRSACGELERGLFDLSLFPAIRVAVEGAVAVRRGTYERIVVQLHSLPGFVAQRHTSTAHWRFSSQH